MFFSFILRNNTKFKPRNITVLSSFFLSFLSFTCRALQLRPKAQKGKKVRFEKEGGIF